MNEGIKVTKTDTTLKSDKVTTGADKFIKNIQQAEQIAEYIEKSKTFGRAFADEDGNINKSDVIAAVMLGSELGIEPMSAITLGKRLNADSYFKVIKGRSLGLDPVSALSSVNIIETKNGTVIHTGVNVISKVLIDAGVQFEISKDYDPIYGYVDTNTNSSINYEKHKHKIFLVDGDSSAEEVTKAKNEGKIIAFEKIVDRVTEIKFERSGFKPISIKYTLQEAIDAGLHRGKSSTGEIVEGKANWNNHPATMLRNRCLTIGGRIICGDRLQKTYSNEEVEEFTDYNLDEADIEDIKDYVKEDIVEENQVKKGPDQPENDQN